MFKKLRKFIIGALRIKK